MEKYEESESKDQWGVANCWNRFNCSRYFILICDGKQKPRLYTGKSLDRVQKLDGSECILSIKLPIWRCCLDFNRKFKLKDVNISATLWRSFLLIKFQTCFDAIPRVSLHTLALVYFSHSSHHKAYQIIKFLARVTMIHTADLPDQASLLGIPTI